MSSAILNGAEGLKITEVAYESFQVRQGDFIGIRMASFIIGILQMMHWNLLDRLMVRRTGGFAYCLAIAWTVAAFRRGKSVTPGAGPLLGTLFRMGKATCEKMFRGIKWKGSLACPGEIASITLNSIEPISFPDPPTGPDDNRSQKIESYIQNPCRVRDWKMRFVPTLNNPGALTRLGVQVLLVQESLKRR